MKGKAYGLFWNPGSGEEPDLGGRTSGPSKEAAQSVNGSFFSPHLLQAPGTVDVEVKVVEKLEQGGNLLRVSRELEGWTGGAVS